MRVVNRGSAPLVYFNEIWQVHERPCQMAVIQADVFTPVVLQPITAFHVAGRCRQTGSEAANRLLNRDVRLPS